MHRRRFLCATAGLAAGPMVAWPAMAQEQATWIANLGHGLGIAVHDLSDATLDICVGAGFTFGVKSRPWLE